MTADIHIAHVMDIVPRICHASSHLELTKILPVRDWHGLPYINETLSGYSELSLDHDTRARLQSLCSTGGA